MDFRVKIKENDYKRSSEVKYVERMNEPLKAAVADQKQGSECDQVVKLNASFEKQLKGAIPRSSEVVELNRSDSDPKFNVILPAGVVNDPNNGSKT